jgi:hypothetical protein
MHLPDGARLEQQISLMAIFSLGRSARPAALFARFLEQGRLATGAEFTVDGGINTRS